MYYGRKKGIIIAVVIIVLILILAIGGVFAYLYTDLFKSNETLFLKYIDQAAKSMEYNTNVQMQDISNMKQQKPFEIKGELKINYEGETDGNLEKLADMKLNINSNVDNSEEKSYAKATLTYQEQNLFELQYANSNNIYALKSDEIVTAFVGVRNENLKVLAQKLGITDTAQIPDSITKIDYEELLNITEEEKTHIYNTYLPVITESIPKDNYAKQSDIPVTKDGVGYNTTAYRLDLSSEEIANITVKILETLRQDSITLNFITTKAKLLNLSEEYTKINNLTETIQDIIDEINEAEKLPEEGLSIITYVENGQTVLTEFIIKNNAKITIYGSNENQSNNIYMIVENLSTEEDYTTLEIEISDIKTDNEYNKQILINKDNEIGVQININHTGIVADGNILSNYEIRYNEGENTIIADYEQELEFVEETEIMELDNTNCGILNDYPTGQITALVQSITEYTRKLLNQKMQQIGINFTNNQEEQIQDEVLDTTQEANEGQDLNQVQE